jgi:hypothetical protein
MSKHRNKIIAVAVIFCVLAVTWAWGGGFANRSSEPSSALAASQDAALFSGDTNRNDGEVFPVAAESDTVAKESDAAVEASSDVDAEAPLGTETPSDAATLSDEQTPDYPEPSRALPATPAQETAAPDATPTMLINPETGKDQYLTDPVPQGKPLPVEPQDAKMGEAAHTVTLSVRCDTIRDNLAWLDKEKHGLVPADGVIFPATAVTFYEGESVFNVLQREMKRAKIHMEFVSTPLYNSAYIEGINNLYEFDVGELSGWMYKVNDWFPNYGCSRYALKDGDTVEWLYTCDLGRDIGGFNAIGGRWPAQ